MLVRNGRIRAGRSVSRTAQFLCSYSRSFSSQPALWQRKTNKPSNSGHNDNKTERKSFRIFPNIEFFVETQRPNKQDGKKNQKRAKSENEGEDPQEKPSSKGKQPSGPSPGDKWSMTVAIAGAVASTVILFSLVSSASNGQEMSWEEFRRDYLDRGLVDKIFVVNKTWVRAFVNTGQFEQVVSFSVGNVDSFDRKLDQAQEDLGVAIDDRIPVAYVSEVNYMNALMTMLPTVLLIGGLYYIVRKGMQGGGAGNIFNVGKSTAKRFNQETDIKVSFKDVAGADEAKEEIMEFVSFLKEPAKYEKLGAKIPRGAILSGPPGTGKTMLARATAGEAGVPFYSVSGSEFVEMFVGVGASRVRDLFATARKDAPSIVFIDEIDAIGRARSPGGSFGGGHDEREATLNQILVEMDGFKSEDHVVVLAGTNRVDILDKALLRPGRFDRHITVDAPDVGGRKSIYKVYLNKIKTDIEIDELAGRLAALTPGFAGADIANCVNEGALIAARKDKTKVEVVDFEQAIERISHGLEKTSKVLNPEERRSIAYHEAGHAICGWYLQHTDPLLKVTIIPRGQSLGYAKYMPSDIPLPNNLELNDRMVMALGGRVSEELHFDTTSSGASSDFQQVTRIATNMVTTWGMSPKVGWLNFEQDGEYYTKPFSEQTAAIIDSEVRRIVNEAYSRCTQLLTEKKKEVALIAEALLSKETLSREDVIAIIGPRPFPETHDEFKYLTGNKEGGLPPVDQPEV